MAYLNKHGLYRPCRFSTVSTGLLQPFLEHLLHCINTNAHKSFIFITSRSHLLCVKGDRRSISFSSAGSNQVIVGVIFWTIVLPVTHAAMYLLDIIASDPRLHFASSDIASSACLSCWLAWLSGYPCCSLGQQVSFCWTLLSNLSGSAQR